MRANIANLICEIIIFGKELPQEIIFENALINFRVHQALDKDDLEVFWYDTTWFGVLSLAKTPEA